jgi:hypothetical protein
MLKASSCPPALETAGRCRKTSFAPRALAPGHTPPALAAPHFLPGRFSRIRLSLKPQVLEDRTGEVAATRVNGRSLPFPGSHLHPIHTLCGRSGQTHRDSTKTLPRVGALDPQGNSATQYHRLRQADAKAKRVISQLEKIEIDDVSFEKLSTSEALGYLTKKVVGAKGGGVINFVIRGADGEKKVGIKRKSLNFAQAVDEICIQSGRVWKIDFNEVSGAPILVITIKNG